MQTQHNKTIVQRYLEEAVSRGSETAIEAYVSPDVVFTSPYTPQPIHGIAGIKQMIAGLHVAFPDLQIREEAVVEEGDIVASRWVATGTQTGDFMGNSPSGRPYKITGMSFYRVKDGKIVEGWVNDDTLGMLQQLGVIPLPA
jgi:steroid delta-isomerase-like uncharacterized protein